MFRLIWGVAGSSTARFSQFVKGPRDVLAYVRGVAAAGPGHTPLGALSVVAMLAAVAVQVGLGLFSVDEDSIEAGPLSKFLSFDDGRTVAHWHHWVFWGLAGLIALHLIAIGVYAARRKNLVRPMITGRAELEPGATPPSQAPVWRIVPAAAAAASVTWFIAHGLRW